MQFGKLNDGDKFIAGVLQTKYVKCMTESTLYNAVLWDNSNLAETFMDSDEVELIKPCHMEVTVRFVDAELGWLVSTVFPERSLLSFAWFTVKPTRKQRTHAIRNAVKYRCSLPY